MKRMMLLFVLFVSVAANTVRANDENENVSRRALRAFEQKFPNARLAKWSPLKNGEVYEVTFIYNNERVISYVGTEGEVIAFARNAMNERLPFMVNETLQKEYAGFNILAAEELVTNNDVSYLFTMENEKKKQYVRIHTSGEFSVIRKMKK